MNYIYETPHNIQELKSMADNKTDWKVRLDAVHKMRKYHCEEVMDIIISLALHDRVFTVKKEAYKAALALGITVNGKPMFLGKKDTGYKLDDFKEIFHTIKKQCNMEKIDVGSIKYHLKKLNPEMFDVMSQEKGKKFDSWIRDIFGKLPKDKD